MDFFINGKLIGQKIFITKFRYIFEIGTVDSVVEKRIRKNYS